MLNFAITAFLTIFIIVNPIGNAPVALSITEDETPDMIRRIVRRASMVMSSVLILFAVTGQLILEFFHLSLAAISISGGLVLFVVALNMIQAERIKVKSRPEEESEALAKDDVSVVPLAVPILAGPGSITSVIILSGNASNLAEQGIVVAAIAVVGLITFLVLSRAAFLLKLMGRTGINVGTRLMGLLLCALAIQFIINGISDVVPMIAEKMHAANL